MRQGFIPLVVIVVVSTLVGCSSSTALEGEKFYIQSGIGRAFLPRDIAAVNIRDIMSKIEARLQ